MSALLAWWVWLAVAWAGNDRGNAYGAQAALTAGALVATTREAEATWYNPAGLGGTERTRLNVNLSAFVLRIRRADPFLTTRIGPKTFGVAADATQLVSVPSSVTLVRRIDPRTTLGFGVYVTRQDRVNLLTSLQEEVAEPWTDAVYTQAYQVLSEEQQFHAGLSVGGALTDRVRLGGSVMGVYDKVVAAESFVADLVGELNGEQRQRAHDLSSNVTANALGVRGVLALQWEFVPRAHLGLVVRTPVLGFYRWGKSSLALSEQATGEVLGGADAFFYDDQRLDELGAFSIDPMRISLAFGYVHPRFVLGVEGEIAFGVVADNAGQARRVHGNVALGGRFQLGDRWWLGAGLFTDLSPTATVQPLTDRMDFFGATLGPEIRNPVRARGRDDGIVFSTMIGLRYAAGVGPFGTLLFEPLAGDPDDAAPSSPLSGLPQTLVFHEISLLLGSAVAF